MTSEKPSRDGSKPDPKAERLAKALRDNLRRRKAASAPDPTRDKDDAGEG